MMRNLLSFLKYTVSCGDINGAKRSQMSRLLGRVGEWCAVKRHQLSSTLTPNYDLSFILQSESPEQKNPCVFEYIGCMLCQAFNTLMSSSKQFCFKHNLSSSVAAQNQFIVKVSVPVKQSFSLALSVMTL